MTTSDKALRSLWRELKFHFRTLLRAPIQFWHLANTLTALVSVLAWVLLGMGALSPSTFAAVTGNEVNSTVASLVRMSCMAIIVLAVVHAYYAEWLTSTRLTCRLNKRLVKAVAANALLIENFQTPPVYGHPSLAAPIACGPLLSENDRSSTDSSGRQVFLLQGIRFRIAIVIRVASQARVDLACDLRIDLREAWNGKRRLEFALKAVRFDGTHASVSNELPLESNETFRGTLGCVMDLRQLRLQEGQAVRLAHELHEALSGARCVLTLADKRTPELAPIVIILQRPDLAPSASATQQSIAPSHTASHEEPLSGMSMQAPESGKRDLVILREQRFLAFVARIDDLIEKASRMSGMTTTREQAEAWLANLQGAMVMLAPSIRADYRDAEQRGETHAMVAYYNDNNWHLVSQGYEPLLNTLRRTTKKEHMRLGD